MSKNLVLSSSKTTVSWLASHSFLTHWLSCWLMTGGS